MDDLQKALQNVQWDLESPTFVEGRGTLAIGDLRCQVLRLNNGAIVVSIDVLFAILAAAPKEEEQ